MTSPRTLAVPSAAAVAIATTAVLPLSLVGGLAIQLSADLDVPVSALGAVSAAFFGAGTLVSPFAGALVGRLGARGAMRVAVLVVGAVLVAIGAWAGSLLALLVLLALGGAGNALAQPATNQFLAERVDSGRQGTAYGIKQSAIPAAGLLAGLAVPTIGLTVGWRWAFLLLALPAVVLAAWVPGGGSTPAPLPASAVRVGLPRTVLVVIAVGAGLAAACATGLSIFLVAGAVEAGWSEASAGLLLAGASAVGVLARLGSGLQADRRGGRHLEVVAVMLGLGALGFAALAWGHPLGYAVGAVVAYGLGWGWPGLLILSIVQLHPSDPAAATALTQVGTSAGAVIGPLGYGLVVEAFGYRHAFTAAGIGVSLAAATILVAAKLARDTTTGRAPDRRRPLFRPFLRRLP